MSASDKIALGALIVSVLTLLWTIISSIRDRRYTRQQVSDAQRQFSETHIPIVTVKVAKDPEGVYLQVKNESSTIAANKFTAKLSGTWPPGGKIDFASIPSDIEPGAEIQVRGSTKITNIYTINMDATNTWGVNTDTFPLSLEYSYLPKQDGAQTVHKSRKVYLEINQ